jgi:hypothetical protein
MALNTGKKIVCCCWDVIPMPDVVIAHVDALGSDQTHKMSFTDIHGHLMGDIDIPGVDSNQDDVDHFPGVVPVIADNMEILGVDIEGP